MIKQKFAVHKEETFGIQGHCKMQKSQYELQFNFFPKCTIPPF